MSVSCMICHEHYQNDEHIVSINKCGHTLHYDCLENWRKHSSQSKCPLCRKPFTKRSLTKLYLTVQEPEVNNEILQELQKQKEIAEKKDEEFEKLKESCVHIMSELNNIKTDYGIKCQAYSIIDTVNNEYLQTNEKLRNENKRLLDENEDLKRKIKKMRLRQELRSQKFVDLTNDDASDSEVEFVDKRDGEIIEINDDNNEIKLPEVTKQNYSISPHCEKEKDENERFEELEPYWRSWIVAQK